MGYFPNASCPGALKFQSECDDCLYGQEPCPVALVHLVHNYDQCDDENFQKAMKTLVSDDGTCNMKKLIDEVKDADV